ncbi:histidinol dehydrogenase [Pseudoruegeria sp. SK021]|uniref:histidinol dehydrogenase n=1 Tax=Pseudoruegeria sp. SK021 TaxID=1933035 RepID=UPI000A2580C0|nr:histidinol dehydrogenase [Pseudoruegeria sp. SK021]OSP55389.1 hypothetical protein BV911_08125 [Pseudoruegeria sp. SK021]
MIFFKTAVPTAETDQDDGHDQNATMVAGGNDAARDCAGKLDKGAEEIRVSPERHAAAAARVPDTLKADIQFAYRDIRRFAEAQRESIGLMRGRRVPVDGDDPLPDAVPLSWSWGC